MHYPQFFDTIKPIVLYDALAKHLGTFEDGIIEISYLNAVQMAGHSCPTVAGSYLATALALEKLYLDTLPHRGEIEIYLPQAKEHQASGVVALVIANITGASDEGGFKGLDGKFDRRGLVHFEADIDSFVRFKRKDTGDFADVYYDFTPAISHLRLEDFASFAQFWQKRVETIFKKHHAIFQLKINTQLTDI